MYYICTNIEPEPVFAIIIVLFAIKLLWHWHLYLIISVLVYWLSFWLQKPIMQLTYNLFINKLCLNNKTASFKYEFVFITTGSSLLIFYITTFKLILLYSWSLKDIFHLNLFLFVRTEKFLQPLIWYRYKMCDNNGQESNQSSGKGKDTNNERNLVVSFIQFLRHKVSADQCTNERIEDIEGLLSLLIEIIELSLLIIWIINWNASFSCCSMPGRCFQFDR